MNVSIKLGMDRSDHFGVAVAKCIDSKSAEEIQVPLAILRDKIATFATINFERKSLVRLEKELRLTFE
jgi:hypothetical protein